MERSDHRNASISCLFSRTCAWIFILYLQIDHVCLDCYEILSTCSKLSWNTSGFKWTMFKEHLDSDDWGQAAATGNLTRCGSFLSPLTIQWKPALHSLRMHQAIWVKRKIPMFFTIQLSDHGNILLSVSWTVACMLKSESIFIFWPL